MSSDSRDNFTLPLFDKLIADLEKVFPPGEQLDAIYVIDCAATLQAEKLDNTLRITPTANVMEVLALFGVEASSRIIPKLFTLDMIGLRVRFNHRGFVFVMTAAQFDRLVVKDAELVDLVNVPFGLPVYNLNEKESPRG